MTAPSRLTWKTWSQEVHTVALDFEKPGDIAAGTVQAVGAADDNHSDVGIVIHASDDRGDVRARSKLIVFMGGRSKIR